MKNDFETLKQFLEFPTYSSSQIFEKFKTIKNAIFREKDKLSKERFLFVSGKKKNKVVLVAHADTDFDDAYNGGNSNNQKHFVVMEEDCLVAKTKNGERVGLGADDRAGCAILWILKDSGHSILITDGEEHGRIGSRWLMEQNQDIAEIINEHQFMIQFDRRNNLDFKCYDVGTDEFRSFIKKTTGYSEPDRFSFTDICTLCDKICGVNLSVGYYCEHSKDERINPAEWMNTLNIARKLLKKDLQKFER